MSLVAALTALAQAAPAETSFRVADSLTTASLRAATAPVVIGQLVSDTPAEVRCNREGVCGVWSRTGPNAAPQRVGDLTLALRPDGGALRVLAAAPAVAALPGLNVGDLLLVRDGGRVDFHVWNE